ncbi:hypothetical protein Asru_0257_11 [Acidisphaera rubrifaciens HS-AP3]|uniref:Uncharacterized protein n=1 Tax=Acidisphaera rubrifaciens HS-AP3 TaxID=1231350 RepID=A0A0D6P8P2_9PROT|nr:hypothetical protein Asru_0257_11 [Acidisphaera rubrifaciens HS-AP3]
MAIILARQGAALLADLELQADILMPDNIESRAVPPSAEAVLAGRAGTAGRKQMRA